MFSGESETFNIYLLQLASYGCIITVRRCSIISLNIYCLHVCVRATMRHAPIPMIIITGCHLLHVCVCVCYYEGHALIHIIIITACHLLFVGLDWCALSGLVWVILVIICNYSLLTRERAVFLL